MTVATDPVVSLRRSPRRRSPYLRTLRWSVSAQVKLVAWFAGVLALLWVAVVLAVNSLWQVEMSIMQFARGGAGVWFPFSIAVSFCAASLGPHVAAGMTRRVYALAGISTAVVMGALYGSVITLGFVVERAVYGANGWEQAITDVSWAFVDVGDLGAVFADAALVVAVASLSGLLVGLVYFRHGAWAGTLTLPFTIGPLLVTFVVLSRGVQLGSLAQPARFAIVVGFGVVLAAAFFALVRTVPIPSPKG